MGRRVRWSKIFSGLLLFLFLNNRPVYASDCWETCFSQSERGQENAEYEQIIGLFQSFKKALRTDANTGTGASNGTALLLDTTLPRGTDRMDADNTIAIQRRIGQILAITLPMLSGYNPGYLVKFDERSAWSCDEWKCLGRCDMYQVLEKEADGFTTFASEDINSDMLDESCELASFAASTSTCSGSTHNTFAVALVNSDFRIAEPDYRNMEDTLISSGLDILSDHDLRDFGEVNSQEFNYYCDKHFPKKAIVGTNSASARTLAEFPSASTFDWPGYSQITFSSAMRKATDRISNCMHTSCCANRQSEYDDYDPLTSSGTCSRFSDGQLSIDTNP